MQLTLHTDYALRLLIYLGVHRDEPASVAQVAEAYGISAHHLAKVARRLTQCGWIHSTRGRSGGISLAEAAKKLTVGDVVRELETNRRLVECFGEDSTCPIEPACGLKHALAKAERAFLDTLDDYPMAKLMRRPKELRVLLNISAGV